MLDKYLQKISSELNVAQRSIKAAVELLDGGATVPFIARYRKEVTGNLDEVAITNIRDRVNQLRELDKRRDAILASLTERKLLKPDLKAKILAVESLTVLEDIYLPFRPKRRTRATVAKEKGLEPLAKLIFEQGNQDPEKEAEKYINKEKKVKDTGEKKAKDEKEKTVKNVAEALAGARDIIAEWINETAEVRAKLRELFFDKGKFKSKVISGKSVEGTNYKDYFDWADDVKNVPSHRILAVRRGEKEKILSLRVVVPRDEALEILKNYFIKAENLCAEHVTMAVEDGFKRLLSPSMETEMRVLTKKRADQEAIEVFTQNLRQILMAPPLGHKKMLAIDPGFRTGCKLVCLDSRGKLEHQTTIYPTSGEQKARLGEHVLRDLCNRYDIEFIAIGNGTASRETENYVRSIGLPDDIQIAIVSESGASIYSASEAAREEFPDYDVTVRGSVSIGRRLMDPLAELVKIDPKSIGVGQYQHDVDQHLLKQSLDDVVVSCVNQVGVELNTASKQLLTYVSGLGPTRAKAIVLYREDKGPFKTREELFEVPNVGVKAIEQAAGFLRIRDGLNPLDASAVHPESYHIVEKMARDINCKVQELMKDEEKRKQIKLDSYVTKDIGLPTLSDIYEELRKPGRDPRDKFEVIQFKEGIEKPEDIYPGMQLTAVVTNITNFGAFVDIGVHLDGLIHISQLSDKYIKHPGEIVKLHQKVMVTVLEIDLNRKRIALSMKSNPDIAQ
ncbi:MAG: RNA-binding transcriptional accessory protein [Candidatus Omnitrophica bacterium]|nr:RNA-binding transcriptional accessory protein [Candidatus Omnitrophota bacterium]